ncbi:MAG: type I restriction enzyme HsdR N-terminal domain-containing protein [Flavobacteriaceae bacterium]|nr:type I restriction enzyme HsdR N-terminal domain-containing protein [Flavobacteriaceae bacterium]
MKTWKEIIEHKLDQQKNNIANINLEKETVNYSEKIKHNRALKSLTGDEEVVRAFLIDRLVNELHYKPENLEIEKEYTIKGGHSKISPRVVVLVKDEKGNPFFFIEVKAPNKFEADKDETRIDKKYLALLFNSFFGRLYFKYASKGKNQTMVIISSSELYDFYLPIPDIEIQRKIVKKIQTQIEAQNHIDQEIEINRAKINLILEEAIRNKAYV